MSLIDNDSQLIQVSHYSIMFLIEVYWQSVRKKVFRNICESGLQIIMARTWNIVSFVPYPRVVAKGDLSFRSFNFSWFILISTWSGHIWWTLFESGVSSHWISTASLQPRVIIILKLFVRLNRKWFTPGPGTLLFYKSLIFWPIFIDRLDFNISLS